MLHNKISKSLQVDNLSLPAQLLFSWMIAWADDEGKLRGEPKYVKGTVVPLKNWSLKNIQRYLEEIRDQGLIYYWSENNEQNIELVKWNEHQQLRKDRLIKSPLPSFKKDNDNQVSTTRQPDDNHEASESNISESSPIKFNKSESNGIQTIADKNSFKSFGQIVNPKSFQPTSEGETAALFAWRELELNNPLAFMTTYLKAYKCDLPANKFYEFVSEIQQDKSARKPGALFNEKVDKYFKDREQVPTVRELSSPPY